MALNFAVPPRVLASGRRQLLLERRGEGVTGMGVRIESDIE